MGTKTTFVFDCCFREVDNNWRSQQNEHPTANQLDALAHPPNHGDRAKYAFRENGSPEKSIVQRDDGMWSIGWHALPCWVDVSSALRILSRRLRADRSRDRQCWTLAACRSAPRQPSETDDRGRHMPIPSVGCGPRAIATGAVAGHRRQRAGGRRETPAGAGMNPHETQSRRIGSGHLSVIERA